VDWDQEFFATVSNDRLVTSFSNSAMAAEGTFLTLADAFFEPVSSTAAIG
jgi:hypothetical protein